MEIEKEVEKIVIQTVKEVIEVEKKLRSQLLPRRLSRLRKLWFRKSKR